MANIIGRKEEIQQLRHRYESDKAEFIAIYGRRRVGKTFLVKEVFKNQFAFMHTGLAPMVEDKRTKKLRRVSMADQLENFHYSLIRYGLENEPCPKSWMEAFFLLEKLLRRKNNGRRQVVFIDEMPWMDTPRAKFLTAVEAFWNGWGSGQDNLMFIVCGSATSWILDKLINAKRGMFHRVTNPIHLHPFTLNECKQFYDAHKIRLSQYDITESYMVFGGIPYYMDFFLPGNSVAQNIDQLLFCKDAKLKDEFGLLFSSVFTNAEDMMKIIRALGRRHCGFTRDEISQMTGIATGGTLSDLLRALVESDFICKYVPFGTSGNVDFYKLTDNFCWFWLHFMEGKKKYSENFWQTNTAKPELNTWRGLAFEEVCFNHIPQIKRALGIAAVQSHESSYVIHGNNQQDGMQIDLLIDRDDRVMNVCEMKFLKSEFVVTSAYYDTIQSRIEKLAEQTSSTIHSTLVTNRGLSYNEYSSVFQSVITLDDLFG